ncbi:uncharacterized protein PpBr36_09557 [Pyricularia pennisetigena]|uniref:uncharacterized protein n=1 Tax=Pyricularia pennisetigena TaxID=1578925 RepID=UPI001152A749|nr:uncharacterized protein PpBr36_09557 [Pyricularia pennisetigena]TLS21615.1 hypothetical protein PpBr36_09557 [Pyricularia pennisetigena]
MPSTKSNQVTATQDLGIRKTLYKVHCCTTKLVKRCWSSPSIESGKKKNETKKGGMKIQSAEKHMVLNFFCLRDPGFVRYRNKARREIGSTRLDHGDVPLKPGPARALKHISKTRNNVLPGSVIRSPLVSYRDLTTLHMRNTR